MYTINTHIYYYALIYFKILLTSFIVIKILLIASTKPVNIKTPIKTMNYVHTSALKHDYPISLLSFRTEGTTETLVQL